MSPIEAHELSAFLDGELPPERAREIEATLEHDASLRAEFEALSHLDASLRRTAATAAFQPVVHLAEMASAPMQSFVTTPRLLGLGAILAIAKLVPRLIETIGISFTLQGCLLAALLYVVWIMLKRETEALA